MSPHVKDVLMTCWVQHKFLTSTDSPNSQRQIITAPNLTAVKSMTHL